ncbi:MAG: class F sortase [Lapillicoccus sp.]
MTQPQGGRRGWFAAAATAVLVIVGVVALFLGLRGQDGPPQPEAGTPVGAPSSASATTPATTPAPTGSATPSGTTSAAPAPEAPPVRIGPFLAASAPTRIEIPSIGVASASFVDLGIAADGTITVPGSADEVGFYTGGPTPGQLGPAVLAAHVDSKQGAGIFYRLGAVKVGSLVKVGRADGSTTTFRVDKVASYPKDQFPTEEVYRGDFTRSEIRLVTCGGPFDKVKHYLDNVVVFGHLESET